MSSGGHTMAEGWNLQLQGRVRDLEADLAEAEKLLTGFANGLGGVTYCGQARAFVRKIAAKRERAAAQAKDIDAFLEQESPADERDGTKPSSALERKP